VPHVARYRVAVLVPLAATLLATAATTATATATATAKPIPIPSDAAIITVARGAGGNVIPPGFLGLSLENSAVIPYAGSDPKAPDPVLLQLIRNLTPRQSPVLRIGGDSTDWAWYPVPGLSKPKGVRVTLTPRWLAMTHALASDLNARLILGVDLEADSRAAADGEASAFEQGIGSRSIEALELGNEPNLYGSLTWYVTPSGVHVFGRPSGYGFQTYLGEFSSFGGGLPGPLAGPATGSAGWVGLTGQFLAAEPRVRLATVHAYPVQSCDISPSSPLFPTVGHLLAPRATTGLADGVASAVAAAHSRHLPVRVDEMNTDSCGSAPGVSNAFVSALWALDALFEMARVGVDGVNIHTYPGATYQLFTFRYAGHRWRAAVNPEYYGLDMFAQAVPPGSRLMATTATNAQGITVWATQGPRGRTRVVLINESVDRRTIALSSAGDRTATLERLRAPSLTSTAGVTLGGQSFGAGTTTGRLAGHSSIAQLTASHGRYVFTLPAESAVLATF
jgi:hypothetical protein